MKPFQILRLPVSPSSIAGSDSEEKTPSKLVTELQAMHAQGPAPAHAIWRKAGSRMALRLQGMGKLNANAKGSASTKTCLNKNAGINSLPSEKRIYADDLTRLNLDEIAAMTSALHIPWSQDMERLERSIAGRLGKMSALVNCVVSHSVSPHGFVPPQASTMAVIGDDTLDHRAFQRSFDMSEEQARVLKKARKLANMDIVMVGGQDRLSLALYFDSARAASDWKEVALALAGKGRIGRNIREIMNTAMGTHGDAFAAVKDAAAVFAEMSEKGKLRIDMVGGHSLGGGYAQYFKAAYESRVSLGEDKPAMVLLDPMLLNNSQAADAIKGTPYGYDYSAPRGVAITLDNAKAPKKSLLSRMKGAGFKHPGLVELKLNVEPGDAATFQWAKDAKGRHLFDGEEPIPLRQRDTPSPGILLGYHADTSAFEMAMHRFALKRKR